MQINTCKSTIIQSILFSPTTMRWRVRLLCIQDLLNSLPIYIYIYIKRVNWNFLKVVLTVMNFDSKWINWIMECVSLVEYTLLINGGMTRSFKPSHGLRQGDPLSPYLFLLCANILSISLTQVEDLRKIKGIKFGRSGLSFSHLLFADDSLLFF